MRKRADLLRRVNGGELAALEPLIAQDLNMRDDWWNARVFVPGPERDLKRAERMLGASHPRYQALATMAALARDPERMDPEKIRGFLKSAGLILEGGTLPASSLVASRLIHEAIAARLITPSDISNRFGAELARRANASPGDSEALNILCYLCVQAKAMKQLAILDRQGWERFHESRFAESLLVGMAADGSLAQNAGPLDQALREFPESSILCGLRLRLRGREKLTPAELATAIKAEYRLPSLGMLIRDTYTLKGLFAELKQSLEP